MQFCQEKLNKHRVKCLQDVENACFPDEKLSRRSLRRFVNKDQHYLLIDLYKLELQGALVYIIYKHSLRIYSVGIMPKYQGQGLGKVLVNYAKYKATELSKSKVTLECRDNLVPFYYKLGFTKTKLLKNYYNNGDDAWKMVLKIS